MLRIKMKTLTAVILASSLGGGSLIQNAQADIKENVTVSPMKTISPQEEQTISSAATKVLRHIAEARSNLNNKDADAAKDQLEQAETLLKIIDVSMPVNKVKDRIWVAKKHLQYEDVHDVIPDLVPIYSSLDELTDYMPVAQAKQHLDKAKEHLKQNNKQKAIEELDATDAALVYTEMDLPLKSTRQSVATAKAEITKGKLKQAETTLESAEDSVSFLSVDVQEPLTLAKHSLLNAIHNYSSDAYDQTKTDLKRATAYLQSAAESTDETTHKESSKLAKEAESLQNKVASQRKATAKQLDQLWQRTAALARRAIENMSVGWSSLRGDSKIKSDLIDAQLHVSNARIDRYLDDDTKQAKSELDNSLSYLDNAVDNAGDTHKARVKQLQSDVKILAKDLSGSSDKRQRYADIEQQMSQLIDIL